MCNAKKCFIGVTRLSLSCCEGVVRKTNPSISNRNIVMRLCQNSLWRNRNHLKVIKSILLSVREYFDEEKKNITVEEWVQKWSLSVKHTADAL